MGGYGLIGERLGHSYSPQIHKMLGAYPYRLIPLEKGELDAFFAGTDLEGFNITIPYKEAALPYMRELSPEARRIGSVNTVTRLEGGGFRGDNTDYFGFMRMLGDTAPFRGRKALVLGSGGASRTVRVALRDAGINAVVISRHGEDNYENLERHRDAALIVNATPVGMYPEVDASPLDLRKFPECQLALDLIYNPARTKFLLQADSLGIPNRNGLIMLAAQGERAAELFGRREPGGDMAGKIAGSIWKQTRNIALIGMPGCGKSSVGKALAEFSGRPFCDIDDLTEKREGMPVPEIIETRGVAAFRKAETDALMDAAKRSGCVIATGGGVVERPENLDILRMNGVILALSRPLNELPREGRPLSLREGLEALYEKRKPLYDAWSERTYENRDIAETARRIREDWL